MPKFRYIDENDLKDAHTQRCAIEGCGQPAEHKAPKSRGQLRDYQWLCIDHVREFNKRWDYFNGMSQEQIETFQKEASFGHRPTWKINQADKFSVDQLNAALGRFMDGSVASPMRTPPVNHKDRKALAELELDHPVTRDEIKAQYKKLVKRFHPDRNPNNKKAEERFKQITASYNHLMQGYADSI